MVPDPGNVGTIRRTKFALVVSNDPCIIKSPLSMVGTKIAFRPVSWFRSSGLLTAEPEAIKLVSAARIYRVRRISHMIVASKARPTASVHPRTKELPSLMLRTQTPPPNPEFCAVTCIGVAKIRQSLCT